MSLVVGVDIGGTFTDLVMYDDVTGEVCVAKVASTPADPSSGLVTGLEALPRAIPEIGLIVHGTTVATNAVLERKGARCGLIMTRGFRDIIELRRRDRPDTYGLKGQFKPLVSRDCRVEVDERTDYLGNVLVEPGEEALAEAARALLDNGVEVVVVSFLNSYANPENECKAGRVLERIWPNPYVVLASSVLPEIREFERTSTAVLNGYVQPLVRRYLESLMERLAGRGYGRDVLLIQSNGGLMSQQVARHHSVNTILSGPAAGVIAAQHIGGAIGEKNLITCDVGGTSLDIAVVAEGSAAVSQEMSLDYGLPMRIPMLDIRTIGAGGGSIAWLDRAGLLQIGPRSAGAEPGPVCYGMGGTEPTVTDANLVLGRIGRDNPIGRQSGWSFDKAAAEQAIGEHIAAPLGISLLDAAWAILQVANHKIAAGIRMMTVERGYDPRDFALVAYGGGGPLHACAVLEELEIARAVVPPWPGNTSALGCIVADVRHDYVQTLNRRLDELAPRDIQAVFDRHEEEGRRLIAEEGIQVVDVQVRYQADIAYDGQVHEVRTVLPGANADREAVRAAFEEAYRAQYGTALGQRPLRIRTLNTTVIGLRPKTGLLSPNGQGGTSLADALKVDRPVYFKEGFRDCPVYERTLLPLEITLDGPAVIEQDDATTVVEPGMRLRSDALGNLIIAPMEARPGARGLPAEQEEQR
ncbi:MAG: hydantoinase/oxoprolinase family protein [SAR324 cluster bacterium]|nr:hydantoinase/oxoprolinase family protein [SAR324 cluster bacterium]